jgi:hypothetical protein
MADRDPHAGVVAQLAVITKRIENIDRTLKAQTRTLDKMLTSAKQIQKPRVTLARSIDRAVARASVAGSRVQFGQV